MVLKIHVDEIRGPSVGVRVNTHVVPIHWLSDTELNGKVIFSCLHPSHLGLESVPHRTLLGPFCCFPFCSVFPRMLQDNAICFSGPLLHLISVL